ncbi:MAG: CD225/dispanin family protein [Gordonia sp. (in: high G+C Gram-positive bacteria)]|jgi:hypothetical protein|nr:CD225/dispanin family protein [Gordonia sp. (in: high G+C Gram-positive bacteria)]
MTSPDGFEPEKPGYAYSSPQPYGGPQYGVAGPGFRPSAEPDNHLVWAILSTVLCCLPLGIVSIVKSASVSKLWAQGDYAGAQRAADDAKKFAIWSAVATAAIYAVVIIAYVIFFVVLFQSGTTTTGTH